MQIDLLPELPPNGGYENINTAVDVFPKNPFAHPVFSPTAVNTAKVVIDITRRHAYLPTVTITNKGSVFFSNVIHDMVDGLDITLRHATTKHTKAVGVLQRTHATIKNSLKIQ